MPDVSRRVFLKLAAGGGAAIAVDYAGKTIEKLVPYVTPPAPTVPGAWSYYSTVCRECPAGCGMVLSHRDGRVTKAEGNPEHPVSLGALCPRGQSSVQGLYDPDRLGVPMRGRRGGAAPAPVSWEQALADIGGRIAAPGRGRLVVLSDLQTGAMAEVMERFTAAAGRGELLMYEPFNAHPLRRASEILFGRAVVPDHRLDECELIVSFAADFLETWISPVAYARQFAEAHSYRFADESSYGQGRVARFVYVGPRMSMTAANADRYIPAAPGQEAAVAMALAEAVARLGQTRQAHAAGAAIAAMGYSAAALPPGVKAEQIEELAKAFLEAKASVALPGPVGACGAAAVRTALAACLLNFAAGRIGQTVDYAHPHALGQAADPQRVQQALAQLGKSDVLIVHNANAAYTMAQAAQWIGRAGTVVYLGTLEDETARLADYVLPIDSPLEAWGDYEPTAGTHGLMQPTMARLLDSRHAGDLFLELARSGGRALTREGEAFVPNAAKPDTLARGGADMSAADFHQWLRQRWQQLGMQSSETFEGFWTQSLRQGGLWPTELQRMLDQATVNLRPKIDWLDAAGPGGPLPSGCGSPDGADAAATGAVQLFAWPTIMLFDGRLANRGWLQENPEPVSYVCWGSWADIHPDTARRLGLQENDVVELRTPQGVAKDVPVRLSDLQAPGAICLALGQGHTAMGHNAAGVGVNAWSLLAASGPGAGEMFAPVEAVKTGHSAGPVYGSGTQDQHRREILQWTPIRTLHSQRWGDGQALILPLPEGYNKHQDIYPPHPYTKYRWAMVIDLQRCIGCGACAVACYAENNLPVMGAEHSRRFLEMAWLKVVPYRDDEGPHRLGFLPMLCQHCDTGPCEAVCPVYASVHNDEGLNAQVYNRCIGTRYCSNNCPYKVRRFNWLNAPLRERPTEKPEWVKPLDWQLNPEVTVRERGVMEKCTFCIQRIRQVQHQAMREGRPVRDGEVQPACVQTCPAGVYTFGNLLDNDSKVARLTRKDPRRYHVLEDRNTKPAIAYLRRIVLESEKTAWNKT